MKQKSIKNIREEFKKQGIFYTPSDLAVKIRSYVDNSPESVYDPTCGAGNLLRVFPDEVAKYGQELDAEQVEQIDIPNFRGFSGDTLMHDGFKGYTFDCIVANPPFSVKWNPNALKDDERFRQAPTVPPPSKADWAFMLHILHHLKDNGVAVCLEFLGILYRGNREGKIRKWLVEQNYIDRIVHIEGNTFEDTAIATCIVVLKKNRKTTDVTFEMGEKTIIATKETIEANDYVLSPNIYFPDERVQEEVDPIELEYKARAIFISRLRKELEFERIVCEIEKISMEPFIEAIRSVLNEYA